VEVPILVAQVQVVVVVPAAVSAVLVLVQGELVEVVGQPCLAQ